MQGIVERNTQSTPKSTVTYAVFFSSGEQFLILPRYFGRSVKPIFISYGSIFEVKDNYPNGNCQETFKISTIQFLTLILFCDIRQAEKVYYKRRDYWLKAGPKNSAQNPRKYRHSPHHFRMIVGSFYLQLCCEFFLLRDFLLRNF